METRVGQRALSPGVGRSERSADGSFLDALATSVSDPARGHFEPFDVVKMSAGPPRDRRVEHSARNATYRFASLDG